MPVLLNTAEALRRLKNLLKCALCECLACEPCTMGSCEHFFCKTCVGEQLGTECPVCYLPSHVRDAQSDRQLCNAVSLCHQLDCLLYADNVEEEAAGASATGSVLSTDQPQISEQESISPQPGSSPTLGGVSPWPEHVPAVQSHGSERLSTTTSTPAYSGPSSSQQQAAFISVYDFAATPPRDAAAVAHSTRKSTKKQARQQALLNSNHRWGFSDVTESTSQQLPLVDRKCFSCSRTKGKAVAFREKQGAVVAPAEMKASPHDNTGLSRCAGQAAEGNPLCSNNQYIQEPHSSSNKTGAKQLMERDMPQQHRKNRKRMACFGEKSDAKSGSAHVNNCPKLKKLDMPDISSGTSSRTSPQIDDGLDMKRMSSSPADGDLRKRSLLRQKKKRNSFTATKASSMVAQVKNHKQERKTCHVLLKTQCMTPVLSKSQGCSTLACSDMIETTGKLVHSPSGLRGKGKTRAQITQNGLAASRETRSARKGISEQSSVTSKHLGSEKVLLQSSPLSRAQSSSRKNTPVPSPAAPRGRGNATGEALVQSPAASRGKTNKQGKTPVPSRCRASKQGQTHAPSPAASRGRGNTTGETPVQSPATSRGRASTKGERSVHHVHSPAASRGRANAKGETPLHVAAIKGDGSEVLRLLTDGISPNVKDNAGWTPLHEACNHGFAEVAELLLRYGAFINTPGYENDTPLHDAISNYRLTCVKLLVSWGADITARNAHGRTPLDLAETEEMKTALAVPVEPSKAAQVAQVPEWLAAGQVVILTTGLSREQRNQVQKLVSLLRGKMVHDFSLAVTHVVTSTNKEGMCPRTIKYLQAVVSGRWLLSMQWVDTCLEYESHVPEEPFEVPGTSSNPGSQAAYRARRNRQQQLPGLFDGCSLFLQGDFSYPTPSKEELASLLELGGGKLLKREPSLNTDIQTEGRVPYHAGPGSRLTNCSWYIIQDSKAMELKLEDDQLCIAPAAWVLACISSFKLLDTVPTY